MYEKYGYLIDTHTAVAYKVYEDYRNATGDETPTVIASTASAYKFAVSVAEALNIPKEPDGFAYVRAPLREDKSQNSFRPEGPRQKTNPSRFCDRPHRTGKGRERFFRTLNGNKTAGKKPKDLSAILCGQVLFLSQFFCICLVRRRKRAPRLDFFLCQKYGPLRQKNPPCAKIRKFPQNCPISRHMPFDMRKDMF